MRRRDRNSATRRCWVLGCAIASLVLWSLGGESADAQTDSIEAAVKATYLYKFAPFVEWPDFAVTPASAPIEICVLADPAFVALVARASIGQTANGHPFAVVHPANLATAGNCRILFAAGNDLEIIGEELAAVRGKPVLTITDVNGAGPHGIVNFVLRDGRVRFEIDLAQAARSGIAISSKLLSLAVAVRPASDERRP